MDTNTLVVALLIAIAVVTIIILFVKKNKEHFSEVLGRLAPYAKQVGKCSNECEHVDHRFTAGPPYTLGCNNSCNNKYSSIVEAQDQAAYYNMKVPKGPKPILTSQDECLLRHADTANAIPGTFEGLDHEMAIKNCTCELEVKKHCTRMCTKIDGSISEGCIPACQIVHNVDCANEGGWQRPISQ